MVPSEKHLLIYLEIREWGEYRESEWVSLVGISVRGVAGTEVTNTLARQAFQMRTLDINIPTNPSSKIFCPTL